MSAIHDINSVTPLNSSNNTSNQFVELIRYKQWSHIDLLQQLIDHNYTEAEFITNNIKNIHSTTILHQLHELLDEFNHEIIQLIKKHQNEFDTIHNSINNVASQLNALQQRATNLYNTVHRTHTEYQDNYNKLKFHTTRYKHIVDLSHYIDTIHKLLLLVQKIQSINPTQQQLLTLQSYEINRSYSKIASLLHDVDIVLYNILHCNKRYTIVTKSNNNQQYGKTGIQLIDMYLPYLDTTHAAITEYIHTELYNNITIYNQNEISNLLQIYYNYGEELFVDCIDSIVSKLQLQLINSLKPVLAQSTNKSTNDTTNSTVANKLRSQLFESLDQYFELIYNTVMQLYTVQLVLSKKRDPLTQQYIVDMYTQRKQPNNRQPDKQSIDNINNHEYELVLDDTILQPKINLIIPFYTSLCDSMKSYVNHTLNNSQYLTTVLGNEWIKLQTLLNTLYDRLYDTCVDQYNNRLFNSNIHKRLLLLTFDKCRIEYDKQNR